MNLLRQRLNALVAKTPNIDTSSKSNNLPTPRDGHSSLLYNSSIIIFGGDRNKYPYNDLYSFLLP